MQDSTLILIFIIILLFGVVIFLLLRWKKEDSWQALDLLQKNIFELSKMIDSKISESNKSIDYRLSESNKFLSDNIQKTFATSSKISEESNKRIESITKKLWEIEETNKQIKGIGEQLEWLENILKNPKQRGILGEYFLETVLKNILAPENYALQYSFKNKEIVDAVILINNHIIPIDSKFSLENYNRLLSAKTKTEKETLEKAFKADIKKRIDETSKYIRPEEGTMDFAFMFIPSEGVYYDMLINRVGTLSVNTVNLIEYAFKEKHVIIVSPTSFYAYLQTVLQGLKSLQIEEAAKDIQKQVHILWKHLRSYEESLSRLGNSLWVSVNHYNTAYKEFHKIDKDVIKIWGEKEKSEVEPISLERPQI